MQLSDKRRKIGFTLIEVMITFALFLVIASVGIGAYFKYYTFSLINQEINQSITLISQTRFKSLKNPDGSSYGIHIDTATNTLISFKTAYNPTDDGNIEVQLTQLEVTDLSLLPAIGTTNEILFEGMTGKTQNSGSFTISNNNYSYTLNLNTQGVIN